MRFTVVTWTVAAAPRSSRGLVHQLWLFVALCAGRKPPQRASPVPIITNTHITHNIDPIPMKIWLLVSCKGELKCIVPGWGANQRPGWQSESVLVYWNKNTKFNVLSIIISEDKWGLFYSPPHYSEFNWLHWALTCSAAGGRGCRRPGWCSPAV